MEIYDYTSKADNSPDPSIFLAEPTPRDYQTMLECEWRTNAIGILNSISSPFTLKHCLNLKKKL